MTRYKDELLNSIIPFWEQNCVDQKYGGYLTFLDRDGSVYNTEKYMWMQWRIVYEFATLAMSGIRAERKDRWLNIAEFGYNFLVKYGKNKHGQYYFALNREGQPIISPYNIYSEAFATMGSAALYAATNEKRYRESALRSMDNYIKRLKNPKGEWEKSMPARTKRLSLGNYMILANLGLVLKENLGVIDFQDKIDEAADMVVNHFWHPELRILFENINQDFSFDMDSCDGRHLNPGHGLEACWFLLEYAVDSERNELIPKLCDMIKGQLSFGWDKKFGGIFYFMDALGKPHVELQWDMKLWWVHNEALIATLLGYSLTKDDKLLEWFTKVDKWTWKHFPDPEFGEWFGYLNRRGDPTHMLKGGKWKTFFHLPRCLLKCKDVLERMRT